MTKPELPSAPSDGVRDRHQQIAANLRALIQDGDLSPGAKVPSNSELMSQYGVTNRSAQRALKVLKDEGYLVGRTGSGVYVREARTQVVKADAFLKPAAPGEPYPWITAAAQRGQVGSSELLEVSEQPAPARVAAAFGITGGDPVIMRKQILMLDGEPAEMVRNYYPLDIARGTPLEQPKKIKGGSPTVLASLGLRPSRAVDHVLTRLATVEEFIALKLPEDMPVLRQFRVVYAESGQPVEVTAMVKAGQRYEIEYELRETSGR